MNFLAVSAAILAVCIYIPMAIQVWNGKMKGLNLASFVLWSLLDIVAAASIFVKGGNWLLPAAFVSGCMLVIIAILKSRTFKWTWVESLTAVLVIISILVWMMVGPVMATVVSTIGVVIAGLPQAWDIWRKPRDSTLWVWVAYTIVNTMSTMAGKDWSVSERFYPLCCSLLTAVMVLLTLRKFEKVLPPSEEPDFYTANPTNCGCSCHYVAEGTADKQTMDHGCCQYQWVRHDAHLNK